MPRQLFFAVMQCNTQLRIHISDVNGARSRSETFHALSLLIYFAIISVKIQWLFNAAHYETDCTTGYDIIYIVTQQTIISL